MTYVKLDDGFGEHPKIAGLSDGAYRLYVNGLCYCSRRKTDGFISKPMVAALLPGAARSQLNRAVGALEAAGLWIHRQPVPREMADQGYDVRDYLKHQRSREQIEHEQTTARDRWQKFRNAQSTPEQQENNGVANAEPTAQHRDSEVRGQRSEGKDQRDVLSNIDSPPSGPPKGDGSHASRVSRAKKGSRRQRDIEALREGQSTEERYLGRYAR